MMWGNGTAPLWTWLFGLVLIAGLVFLAVAVTWAITSSRNAHPGPPATNTTSGPDAAGSEAGNGRARQILDERFANGEIDSEEYVARRNTLERGT